MSTASSYIKAQEGETNYQFHDFHSRLRYDQRQHVSQQGNQGQRFRPARRHALWAATQSLRNILVS